MCANKDFNRYNVHKRSSFVTNKSGGFIVTISGTELNLQEYEKS